MRPRSWSRFEMESTVSVGQHLEHFDGTSVAGRVDLAQVPHPHAAGDDQAGDCNDSSEVDEVLDRPVRAALALDHQRIGDIGVIPRVVLPVEVVERRAAFAHARGPPASSQFCNITAAAILSTIRRRAWARMFASIIARSAVTVVRRSSKVTTGTATTVASAAASSMAACAAGPRRTAHVERQPDHDDVCFLLDHELGDRLVVTRDAAAALQHLQRRGDGAGAVSDRHADALRPEIEAEGAHGRAAVTCPAASAAIRSASSRPSGFLPPAVAMSPLPPPPPPTAFAASLMRSPATLPDSAVTAATSETPPVSVTPPSTTVWTPGCWRTAMCKIA